MKKHRALTSLTSLAITLFVTLALITIGWASDAHKSHDMQGEDNHDMTKSMSHNDMEMQHNGNHDMPMHTSMVDNHHLSYELIDMREKMKGMENAPAMEATHHMMVYIKSNDGSPLDKAMVGYYVTNPDGSIQKTMAMGMGHGFGADLDFSQKGTYIIKMKAVSDDDKLIDRFEFQVK